MATSSASSSDHLGDSDSVPPIFANGFVSFFKSGLLTDAVVVWSGTEYHVHRLILSYSSEFFTRSFLGDFREGSTRRVELQFPDDEGLFPTILAFMYTGEVALSVDNVMGILSMASALLMPTLISKCMDFVEPNITSSNVVTMMEKANAYHLDDVMKMCEVVVCKNFHFLVEHDISFLPYSVYFSIVSAPNLAVKDEMNVFENVTRYVTDHSDLSPEQVSALFEYVRFPHMTFEELEDAQAVECVPKHLLVEGLMYRLRRHEGGSAAASSGRKSPSGLGGSTGGGSAGKTASGQAAEDLVRLRQTRRPPYSISFEYTGDWDLKGILYWVSTNGLTTPWVNPSTTGKVTVSSSSIEVGNPHAILELEPTECWTKDVPASWFMIDLGEHRSVVPNYYTLRHGGNYKSDALRNWDFQGSTNGTSWITLRRHQNDGTLNNKFALGSWPIEGGNGGGPYRFFRILQTGHSSARHNFLLLSGIELYGDLYQRTENE